jgi:hypothetical protein
MTFEESKLSDVIPLPKELVLKVLGWYGEKTGCIISLPDNMKFDGLFKIVVKHRQIELEACVFGFAENSQTPLIGTASAKTNKSGE